MSTVFKPILILLGALLCLPPAHAQDKSADPDIIMTNGYTFEVPKPTTDTMVLEDPVDGEKIIKYIRRTYPPTTINGARVYQQAEVTVSPEPHSDGALLEQYVLKGLVPLFDQLPDDIYALEIAHVVIDKTGKVVYYSCNGIRNCVSQHTTPANINDAVISKVKELMRAAPVLYTASADGGPVAFNTAAFSQSYLVKVKDHKWSFQK